MIGCTEFGDSRTCLKCRQDEETMAAEAAYERAHERGEVCPGCDCAKAATDELCAVCRVHSDSASAPRPSLVRVAEQCLDYMKMHATKDSIEHELAQQLEAALAGASACDDSGEAGKERR